MPTLKAPPPKAPLAAPVKKTRSWWTHWAFLLAALLFHFLVFLIVANKIIFPAFKPPVDDFSKTYVPAAAPPPPPPPTQTVQVPTTQITTPTPVITSPNAPSDFSIPMPELATATPTVTQKPQTATPQQQQMQHSTERVSALRNTLGKWGRDASNIASANGDPRNVVATFPVYLASYANGDWNCNTAFRGDLISGGSLMNLVEKINEWSHGKIKGTVVPQPLKISTPDLLAKMPPFIFFTGHKDFVLTPEEVSNLQQYLQNGGAIWGDNSLAGSGSRFDVAFRREMKRVLPDKDKNFVPVEMTDPIFAKSWFPINAIPTGMNYYQEPLLRIDIDGKLAVLYTQNDYGDLFYLHILPGDEKEDDNFIKARNAADTSLITNKLMYEYRKNFFRNFELPSALAAQQLGMNIVGHLLVRFDDQVLLTP
jgi:hypothetical protein